MKRSVLTELSGNVGDVLSTGTSVLSDLAAAAATRTGDLASSAIEHAADVPERVGGLARERLGAPPRRRRRPWRLLVVATLVGFAIVWWLRRDDSARVEERPRQPGAGERPADEAGTISGS